MAIKITFLGLVNFHDVTEAGGLVLLPNGVRFGSRIPNHYPRLFLASSGVKAESSWWKPIDNEVMGREGVTEYPIQTWSHLAISGVSDEPEEPIREFESSIRTRASYETKTKSTTREKENERTAGLNVSEFQFVPPLTGVEVVPVEADAIVDLPIFRGALKSYRLAESEVATLTLDHSGLITITATPIDGSPSMRLVLSDNTEIVLTNMSDLFAGHRPPQEGDPSHFSIYSRLDRNRRADRLKEPREIDAGLTPLFDAGSNHPVVAYIRRQFGDIPRPGCGITT